MTIIDAHSHLWLQQYAQLPDGGRVRQLHNGRAEFLGELRQMLPPFIIDGRNSAEVFLSNMDYAQVQAAVVTQEFIDGNQNDYLEDVQRRYPDRFLCCGMCHYLRPGFADEARRLIERGFRAIAIPAHRLPLMEGGHPDRLVMEGGHPDRRDVMEGGHPDRLVMEGGHPDRLVMEGGHPDRRLPLNSPEFLQMFQIMERTGAILSITLAPGDTQVAEMEDVIARCPDLKIAIGHFGMVTAPGWQEQIKLARHKNVMIESGGITWLFNSEFYPFEGAVDAIKEAAELVGIEKLMWGSDYPRTITAITYRMSYDFILKTPRLSDDEKRLFLGENARRFYAFKDLVDLPYIKNMSE